MVSKNGGLVDHECEERETRLRRLDRLIQESALGRSIPPLTRKPKA